MRDLEHVRFAAIALTGLLGCGTAPTATERDASVPSDAPPLPEGYTRLLGRTWSLDAGKSDVYRCLRFTASEDTYVTGIAARGSAGSHHSILTFAGENGTSGPDGDQDNCGVSTIGMSLIYAATAGTAPYDFPPDVGLQIRAGQQLHLNVHLTNATDSVMEGDSEIYVRSQPTATPALAESVFGGTLAFAIPANPAPFTVRGGCTSARDFSLFAVAPHMHRLGIQQRLAITRNGTTTVVHDQPYDFGEVAYVTTEFQVLTGDQIEVTCTFVNNTGTLITSGSHIDQEMCLSGMFRYPATNAPIFECVD
jgi:hypothetical protein